jgi:microcystin degradation protein MlrC
MSHRLEEGLVPRILVVECMQEISSFNPVPSGYDLFVVLRGDEVLDTQRGLNTFVGGALEVFEATPGVELVPTYSARSFSAGRLSREGFERIAAELLAEVRANVEGIDAVYFSLHGAMGADGYPDPEGHLLEECRTIVGDEIPIVISLDLHGILTDRMLRQVDGLTLLQTYPHVDMADTGARAARLLLRVLDGATPVIARVVVPALVRGDELITETGVYGRLIGRARELERNGTALAAGFMIGNPFTDAPELCSQAIVITDGDPDAAEREAIQLAEAFWPDRARMQAVLVPVEEAIEAARELDGTAIFTDAADATSSGATGDSNVILRALLDAGYEGTALLPIVDPAAVEAAFEAGVGATLRVPLGGAFDPRFEPVELDVTVELLSNGHCVHETYGAPNDTGRLAVLVHENITIVAITLPANLFDRSVFFAAGRNPKHYDLVVVKSPHCEPHMFVDWAGQNFGIDAPGSTSAKLASLGHSVCARPMYPLEPETEFEARAVLYGR